ncbi:MAG: CopG family transcriptional regulator [Acidimicrobiales bacterium]
MRRTNLYLDEAQTVAIDEIARAEGISRAELVRRLLDLGIGGRSTDLDADLAAIEGSFGVLDKPETVSRGHDDRAAYLDRMRQI